MNSLPVIPSGFSNARHILGADRGVVSSNPSESNGAHSIAEKISEVRSSSFGARDLPIPKLRQRCVHRPDSPSSDSELISASHSEKERPLWKTNSQHVVKIRPAVGVPIHSRASANTPEQHFSLDRTDIAGPRSVSNMADGDHGHGVVTGSPRPESRFANQIDRIEHQAVLTGLSLKETITMVLNEIRDEQHVVSEAEMNQFVERQAAILKSNGVDTPERLFAMFRQAQRLDLFTACLHGLANSSGFNGASAALNFWGGDRIAEVLDGTDMSALGKTALQGGISGLILAAVSATVGPAVRKTFEDAYYLKPPADKLFDLFGYVEGARTTMAKAGHEQGMLFLKTYGMRNLLRFVASCITAASQGTESKLIKTIDDYIDPIGGCFAGAGFGMLSHQLAEKRGSSGIAYFLARTDLPECIDVLNASLAEKIMSMVTRTQQHFRNSITRLPEGLLNNITTLDELGSAVLLAGGFAGVSVAKALAGAASDGNFVAGEAAKHVATASLYYGYGHGRVAGDRFEVNPRNLPGSKISEGIDSLLQHTFNTADMSVRRRRNASVDNAVTDV